MASTFKPNGPLSSTDDIKILFTFVSSDRSSYSNDGLSYVHRTTFWIFTQSIDALYDVSMHLMSQDAN